MNYEGQLCKNILIHLIFAMPFNLSELSNVQNLIVTLFIGPSNQHVRIISEGSCDTEDWSNDAALSSQK